MNARFHVERTRCDCHPETCCCAEYTLWDGDTAVAKGMESLPLCIVANCANAGVANEPPAAPAVALKYFPAPLRFIQPQSDSDPHGPRIVDANGHLVASLFWPGHPPAETEAAEQETYALGRAMALAIAAQWRCFHCDELFTNWGEARNHFGYTPNDGPPACKTTRGEDSELYRLKRLLELYQNEDTDLHRAVAAKSAEIATAVRQAEETGYARGLEDAKKHPETLGLQRISEPPSGRTALEAFRHMRVYNDDGSIDSLDLRSLDSEGREFTIAYVRSQYHADLLNEAFERVRLALTKSDLRPRAT